MPGDIGRPFTVGGPRIKVRVTAHDIEWATRKDSSRCMVARALAREVDDATRIEVDTQTIRFSTGDNRFAYLTPLTVQRYVATFDAGEPVEPFDFQLRNPMQLKRRLLTPEERAEGRLRRMTETASGSGREEGLPPVRRGGPKGKRTGEGQYSSLPRVFKTSKRTYGARLLRINQPMQPTALDEQQP